MASIIVLYNGRREKVLVTPTMVMQSVLGAACDKFCLPTAQYYLRHKGKSVDLSLPYRFTGISNNAVVDLVYNDAATATEQNLNVLIQLPNGQRLRGQFGSGTSLADILAALLSQSGISLDVSNASLIYLQQGISSDQLPATTLRSLGLLSGSVMFRLQTTNSEISTSSSGQTKSSNQNASELHANAIADVQQLAASTSQQLTGLVPKPQEEPSGYLSSISSNPASKQIKSQGPTDAEEKERQMASEAVAERHVRFAAEPMTAPTTESGTATLSSSIPSATGWSACAVAIDKMKSNCLDVVSRDATVTLIKIIDNIISRPGDAKTRTLRVSNAAVNKKVVSIPGGLEFLFAIGFVLTENNELLQLSFDKEDLGLLRRARKLLVECALDVGVDLPSIPQLQEPAKPSAAKVEFDPYKSQVFRTAEQPVRETSITEIKLQKLKDGQQTLLAGDIPDRQTNIILPNSNFNPRNLAALVEEATSVGDRGDAGIILAAAKRKQDELKKDENFRTRAMRELEQLQRQRIYKRAIVRVQFPDRAIVQAHFHPSEKLASVKDLIISCLADQARDRDFYLFVSPPVQKLDIAKTLNELALVPAALIYLGWTLPSANDKLFPGVYISPDMISGDSESKGEDVSPMDVTEYPTGIALAASVDPQLQIPGRNRSEIKSGSRGTTNGDGKKKVPSWLKLK